MADYKLDKTLFLEERGIQFLKSIGFNIEANNLGDENKTKIDFELPLPEGRRFLTKNS